MKTKLLVLFAAILTISSLSSCIAPYGYGRSHRGSSYHRSSSYHGGYHHNRGTVGGYRGGGNGGGFGGNFGGF
ncbi:MAG: hypothetical protein K9N47_04120 [Prosthecobacter sp.]|uniref:hypothetical protein n=1 Tax=Prosthecobacter sp. TaxID=1965333 RepID=UPI0025E9559A|nr:hypothetical protein [Prosthecobacter sp.]MCF7785281.1 hypothetical protein [Prosthecobacter sp.]